jgi:hypothetical protein
MIGISPAFSTSTHSDIPLRIPTWLQALSLQPTLRMSKVTRYLKNTCQRDRSKNLKGIQGKVYIQPIYCSQKVSEKDLRYTFKNYRRPVTGSFGIFAVLLERRKGKHGLKNGPLDIQSTLGDAKERVFNLQIFSVTYL